MPLFQVGDTIERCIEDIWFIATIEGVNLTRRNLKLRYLDDGNMEENVPMPECRRIGENSSNMEAEGKDEASFETKGDKASDDENIKKKRNFTESKMDGTQCVSKKDTLKKPLAGLIEDDFEIRANHKHHTKVHSSSDTEDAIILHGEEKHMAAGGGLRALRFLKDKN
jgi:hypothetical protein